jgi:tRNA (guanosine-2'-O-)-methyltransferase
MNFTPEEDLRPFQPKPSILPPQPFDSMISDKRASRFRQVLMRRSNKLAVVVEDCHDQHNATAIIRSCDAFGVDTIHIISSYQKFRINKQVSRGTHHFMEIFIHKSTEEAYQTLKSQGYTIFASTLTAEKVINTEELQQIYLTKPIAIVFGEESSGLSEKATNLADGHFMIPMAGFAQSLNVSVALAVTVYAIRGKELCNDADGNLTEPEQLKRYTRWVKRKRGPAVDRVIEMYKGKEIEVEILNPETKEFQEED